MLFITFYLIFLNQCFSQTPAGFSDSLVRLIQNKQADTAVVNTQNKLASYFAKRQSDSALIIAAQAIATGRQIGYQKGVADALLIVSKYERSKGNFGVALQKGLEAFRAFEAINQKQPAAATLVEIAQIYKDMVGKNNTDEYIQTGVQYARQAFNLFQRIGDTAGMVSSLNMQGILFRDKGKTAGNGHYYDTALNLYHAAFRLITLSGKGADQKGKLFNNISQVYTEYKKDYRQSLQYLAQAIAFNTERRNTSSLSYNYGNMAEVYSRMGNYDRALTYSRMMVWATREQGAPARIQNAYQSMYKSFKTGGQMDSALHYYILSDAINDSLTNLARTNQVMNLQVQYETAKKQLEIDRLARERSGQNKRIMALIVGFVLIACLAAAMLYLLRRVSRQKKQIELQSRRLEVVMKELHHRVKNNLQIVSSLLSLQTYKLEDAETISVLKESQQRVQAMSLIHQRLYTADMLTAVNMKEYITDLVESLLLAYGYGPGEFDLNISIKKELLDVEKALPIGLLVNEMVTNALKYAYHSISNPSLVVQLTETADHLSLMVKDNGAGLDVVGWSQKGTSFGKQLISVLGKQLRAQQSVAVDNGTTFTIEIPHKAA